MAMTIRRTLLAFVFSAWAAITPAVAGTSPPSQDIASSPPPSLEQRALIASKLYWVITTYFAHAEALGPAYDFETEFRHFLSEALAAQSRLAFDEAAMKLLGSLRNGHSWFHDTTMRSQPELPFRVRRIDGRWIVTRSRLASGAGELNPGDEITTLDGKPFGDWIHSKLPLLNGSNDTERETLLAAASFLWPQRFRFGLSDGRGVMVDRLIKRTAPWQGLRQAPDAVEIATPRPGLVVLTIPSFDDPRFENAALEAVKHHTDARVFLLDVRGNGGGSTPSHLMAGLIDVPYRNMLDATPLRIGTVEAWSRFGETMLPNAMLRTGGEWVQPDHPLFRGKVLVLADRNCASACEDFVLALHLSHRATILGETTWGSTGQPFIVDFPELGMQAAVSTRREYLPGLLPFEGVGVTPDISIPLTLEALRTGRDDVLAQALKIAENSR